MYIATQPIEENTWDSAGPDNLQYHSNLNNLENVEGSIGEGLRVENIEEGKDESGQSRANRRNLVHKSLFLSIRYHMAICVCIDIYKPSYCSTIFDTYFHKT